jgi:hypothetical protein
MLVPTGVRTEISNIEYESQTCDDLWVRSEDANMLQINIESRSPLHVQQNAKATEA